MDDDRISARTIEARKANGATYRAEMAHDALNLCNACDAEEATLPGGYCASCVDGRGDEPPGVGVPARPTSATRRIEIRRIKDRLDTDSSSRVLDAMGHPGYSDAVAKAALARWTANPARSLHAALGYSGT